MKILGIESSCDDTSVALVEAQGDQFVVLAEKTASQIEIHKQYGGVVPEVAGRQHAEAIFPVIEEVMRGQERPDAIAVTAGPGLITGLAIGVEAARALSYLWDVPLIRTNHMDGHVHSVQIKPEATPIEFPALALLVSGGHTELLLMRDHGVYEKLGATRDDAAGECFDKVAKLLGLEYPGGPKISALAKQGNPHAIPLPRPMMREDNFDFSFAGLKTAALYWLRDNELSIAPTGLNLPAGIFGVVPAEPTLEDFCASLEQAITDVIVHKTCRAAAKFQPKTIMLGGGVSANEKIRESLRIALAQTLPEATFLVPDRRYSMDNGAMIAVAGYYQAQKNKFTPWRELVADPAWEAYSI